jgi:hypothetical protein
MLGVLSGESSDEFSVLRFWQLRDTAGWAASSPDLRDA